MEREIIRVEPFSTNFEKWGAPVSVCTRAGNMVFMSGMPPFDPDTGELLQQAPFERPPERFKTSNEIYKRYFPKTPPARIFFCVPEWTGPFDIEIDCVAVTKS